MVRSPSTSSRHHGKKRATVSSSGRLAADGPAVDGLDRLGAGEPARGVGGHRGTDQREQVPGVTGPEDAELLRQAEPGAEPGQDPVGHRVEGAGHHPTGHQGVGEVADAVGQLGRGPAAEGHEQHALGWHSLVEQAGQSAHQRPGLARPGPGRDEQGAVAVVHRPALGVVEALGPGRCLHGDRHGPMLPAGGVEKRTGVR